MISALRAAIEKIPTREERLGGQTFKYVKLSEVLDLLDTFRSNNADETQPAALNPKLQTRLREIAESLLCREGSGHYCPNCDNTTFDAAMSLKLLADQIGAPVETTTHHCRRCRMLIPWTAGDDPPFCAYCGVSSPVEPRPK